MRKKSASQPASEQKKSQGNIYDTFVKQMFGRMVVIASFLLRYADPKFVAEIDIKKIRPAPTHYIGKVGTERVVDLVFQCKLKRGKGDLMAVIILEHQSESLKKIPFKILKYVTSIWEAETKDGKPLSAPYFIVLRTGKKPHRGKLPKLSDSLPKDDKGNPIGKVIEFSYDLVDLPAWDFRHLVGGPELRLALGILKKMIEGDGDDFGEALLPLNEIADEEQKVELTKELLDFVAAAMKAHNRRFDEAMAKKALKPIYKDKVDEMVKTIFEEKFLEGVAEGEAKWKADSLMTVLRSRFKKVPKSIESEVRKMTDPTALDSWTAYASTCQSLDEFSKSLK
jgi:hypothetical protein